MTLRPLLSLTAGTSLLALSSLALAQTTGNQPRATVSADFSSTLEANDNYDLRDDSLGNALIWSNEFGAGLSQITRTDLLEFDIRGTVRASSLPVLGEEIEADDPRASLLYERAIDDSSFRFSTSYRRVDLDFFDPLGDINLDDTFDSTSGGGTRESLRASVDLTLNEDGPISFALNGAYQDLNFTDTDDPDNDDRLTYRLRGDLGFRLSPILRATAGAAYDVRDADNGTDRERWRTDIGLEGDINQRMTAFARLGYSEVDSVLQNGDETNESGLVGDLGFTTDLRDGRFRTTLSTDLDENGPRATLTFGRTLERQTLELDASLGVSVSDDTSARPVGRIDLVQALPNGSIGLALSQVATTDSESRDILSSNGEIFWVRELTALSSFDVSVRGGVIRYENDDRPDRDRADVTLRYVRTLTRDWGMEVGYRHEWERDLNVEDAQSNAVFLTLRRDWEALR